MSTTTPNAFSASSMTSQVISDLSLLNPLTSTYDGFINKYPLLSKNLHLDDGSTG